MEKRFFLVSVCIFVFLMNLCFSQEVPQIVGAQAASPPAIIYKTKKNYDKNVAIILSEDKKTIVSYPDPKDVYTDGKLCLPTPLKKKFLFDNRGINQNVAFLSITYEAYSRLEKVPSIKELEEMIIDRDPLKAMYVCGNKYQYQNIVEELNQIIKKKCKECIKKK